MPVLITDFHQKVYHLDYSNQVIEYSPVLLTAMPVEPPFTNYNYNGTSRGLR